MPGVCAMVMWQFNSERQFPPMKLATYRDGSRDGQLLVVSRDLSQAHYASQIAHRMQQVLDDWNYLSPQLQDLSDALNAGRARHAFAFDPRQCMAPLPRAYQWVLGNGFPSHGDVIARAAGVLTAADSDREPLLAQGSGANFWGAMDPIAGPRDTAVLDFGAGLAVVTGDLPMGCAADSALDCVRLFMLCNAVHQYVGPAQLLQPGTAFSPVAVTPDELGEAWSRGRLQGQLQVTWNGRKVGLCDAGTHMHFHFGKLISALAHTRPVPAGSVVGSGPVSNKSVERKGRAEWPQGYSSIAEKRAMETLQDGQPSTDFMCHGDTVRIEMKGASGTSIFGAVEQVVVGAAGVSPASAVAQTP